MSDYDLRDSLDRTGFDYTVDEEPIENLGWKIKKATSNEVVIEHPTGAAVHLRQRKPEGGDLPFRTVRVTDNADEHQLAEGDWIDRVLTPALAYMRGYSERGEA
jgi:hypothetical protein